MEIDNQDSNIAAFNLSKHKVVSSFNNLMLKKLQTKNIFTKFNPDQIINDKNDKACNIENCIITGKSAPVSDTKTQT